MTDNRLHSFAARIDRLEDERKAIGGDIKEVYVEVKSAGYNVKALRKVLAERRKKTDAELEADIEMYRAELAKPGATLRGVAADHGISKSKLQRLVPKRANGTRPPHDPATGEIIEKEETDLSGAAAGRPSDPSSPAEQSVNPDPSPGRVSPRSMYGQGEQPGTHSELCGGVESRHAGGISGEVTTGDMSGGRPSGSSTEQVAAGKTPAGVAPGPHDTSVTKAITACIDGNQCLDVRCNLEGCRLKSSTEFETPPRADMGNPISEQEPRVPKPDGWRSGFSTTDGAAEAEADLDALMPPHLRRPKPSRMKVGA